MTKKILSATIFLIAFSAVTVLAQNPEKSVLEARDRFSDIKKRSIELERMKSEANKRPSDDDLKIRFPDIKKDFEQLQILNGNIIKLTSAKTPPDYAAVLKFVTEINHRAARLSANLFSAESDKKKNSADKNQSSERKDMKKLLINLDNSINSFVHSSIFQNLNLVNSQDSLKAQKDLENVIKISFAIKEKVKDVSQK